MNMRFTTVKLDSRHLTQYKGSVPSTVFIYCSWKFCSYKNNGRVFGGFPFSVISLAVSDLCLWGWSVSKRYLDELGYPPLNWQMYEIHEHICMCNDAKQKDIHWNAFGFVHCTLIALFKVAFLIAWPVFDSFFWELQIGRICRINRESF